MHDALAGTVEIRRQDGIAILTLTRPTANNRITRQMAEAGVAALEEVRSDRSITGCVLTGDGNVFCTGGDYRSAGSSSAGRLEFARAHNDLAQATSRLGKPLVAAINGDAHAGGFSLIATAIQWGLESVKWLSPMLQTSNRWLGAGLLVAAALVLLLLRR